MQPVNMFILKELSEIPEDDMSAEKRGKTIKMDAENPEWTKADFARAKGPESLPAEVLAAFPRTAEAVRRRGDDTHGALKPKAAAGAFAEGTANEVDSNGLAVYINP